MIKTGLENSFEISLQQRAYDISKGGIPTISLTEKLFDKGIAEKVVLEPWYGANFSESLWNNKQMFAFTLQKIVTNGMMRGTHPVQMAKELENHSDKSFFACTRLIETETSRIHSEANFEAMKEGGIEYYELLVQDNGCDKCKEWEGKKIPLSKREVGYNAEPLHPFCHCTSIAVDDVDFDTPITPEEEVELDGWKKWINEQEQRYQNLKKTENDVAKTVESSIIKLSKEELWALNKYISSDAYKINEKLRYGLDLDDGDMKFTNYLDIALSKMPRYKGNLLRTLYFDNDDELKNFVDSFSIDDIHIFREYISASSKDDYNFKANVKIYIQNTKNGRDIIKYNSAEQEILYERNSKFKILNIKCVNDVFYMLWEEI